MGQLRCSKRLSPSQVLRSHNTVPTYNKVSTYLAVQDKYKFKIRSCPCPGREGIGGDEVRLHHFLNSARDGGASPGTG